MTEVKKSEEKIPHGIFLWCFCGVLSLFMLLFWGKDCFVTKSVSRDLRAFVWKKIWQKIVPVEQI